MAQRAGLRAGDLLLRAGGAPLREPNDLWHAVLTRPARPVSLDVLRRGAARPVQVRLSVESAVEAAHAREGKALAEERVRALEGAISQLKAQIATLEAELDRLKRER